MSSTVKTFIDNQNPTCNAADLNGFAAENNNLIASTGQTLSASDNTQTAKAVASYAANADFYTDSGSANAYVLSPITYGTNQTNYTPLAYLNGMRVRFKAQNANTATSTVNVNGLGVKTIKTSDFSSNLASNAIKANDIVELEYDSASGYFILIKTSTGTSSIAQPAYVPYSVSSGAVDANGYANFISNVDNTSVKILATTTPITLTHPNGSQETISADYTIGSISTDGTYTIVKEYGSSPVATTSTITEAFVAPASPVNGDYWLNIGVKPYQPFKRISGAWVATQFVKLGEFTRSSAIIGTPTSYALNGFYISQQYGLALSTTYSLNHNIGSQMCFGQTYAVCQVAEAGYAVGDWVAQVMTDPGGTDLTIPLNPTLTRLIGKVRISDQGFDLQSAGYSYYAATLANWKLITLVKRGF